VCVCCVSKIQPLLLLFSLIHPNICLTHVRHGLKYVREDQAHTCLVCEQIYFKKSVLF